MPAHDYNKYFTHPNVIRYDGNLDSFNKSGIAIYKLLDRKPGEYLKL